MACSCLRTGGLLPRRFTCTIAGSLLSVALSLGSRLTPVRRSFALMQLGLSSTFVATTCHSKRNYSTILASLAKFYIRKAAKYHNRRNYC